MKIGGQPKAKHLHALVQEQGEPGDAIIQVKATVNSGAM